MPRYVVRKTIQTLKDLSVKKNNFSVLVLGIAYKKNVDDLRESPALEIIKKFLKSNIKVSYNDPYIMKIPKTRKYNLNLKSIEINKKNLNFFDAVVLITDHDIYNYNFIKHHSKILIDCRGRYKPSTNIIRA